MGVQVRLDQSLKVDDRWVEMDDDCFGRCVVRRRRTDEALIDLNHAGQGLEHRLGAPVTSAAQTYAFSRHYDEIGEVGPARKLSSEPMKVQRIQAA